MQIYPRSTIRSVKSLMGSDEKIKIVNKFFLPEEISAKIIKELVSHVNNINPNAEIAGIVISVPYDFGQRAKKATYDSVKLAGFTDKLISLIEEPKAAALAYNFAFNLSLGENVMVFDFGGGTLDITIFKVIKKTNETTFIKVISEGGAVNHGGDSIDQILSGYLISQYCKKSGKKLENIPIEDQQDIFQKSREAKERLTSALSHKIPFTFAIPPYMEEIKRPFFEELIAPFIEKTKILVEKSLKESHSGPILPKEIDRVLLEGGSSGMPWVRTLLKDIFGEEKIYISKTPALDISRGATYYAAMKMGLLSTPEMEIPIEIDVTIPHDIGVEIISNSAPTFFELIPKGTSYVLAKKSHTFTLTSEEDKTTTSLNLKILERKNKDDNFIDCINIGEVKIDNIPIGLDGKTRLKLTLALDENKIIKGILEDVGHNLLKEKATFRETFGIDIEV